MYLLVAKQLIIMAFITIAAFIFAKTVGVGEKEQKFLSKMLLFFINPCLTFTSFNIEFDATKLKQLGFVALLSLLIHVVMILQGLLSSKEKIERVGVVFTNCGFVGIPLIRGVFGDTGVFYLMGYLVIFNILLWTYGYYRMCGTINIKKIVTNPNIIAVTLGLIVFCTPWPVPEFISRPIAMIGDTNTAMAMILIGILFANFDWKSVKNYWKRILNFTLWRLAAVPFVNLIILAVIYHFCSGMADAKMMFFVVLICSACPAATSVPSLACLFDEDTDFASLAVSITSLLCVLTVPSLVALAELFIK